MIKCARAEGFFLFKLFYSPPFTKPPLLDNRSEERFRARVSGTLSYEDKSVRRSSNGTIVDAYGSRGRLDSGSVEKSVASFSISHIRLLAQLT